jgi:type IV pilus assembly protein PilM
MASFQKILAVDLGASAVRLVELGPDGRGRPTILALSQEEIPFDPGKTSDFFPIYAQALTAAVGRLPGKTRLCHLCLGGPAVFARILKVPASDPAKVGSMIGFEAQQTVPAIEQALWDYQVVPSPSPSEVEALILAIKRETVEELSAAAASAGLKPQSVTLTPAALLNAFSFNYPEATGCNLIMEIGARATTILLVEGSRIFVRVVPLGGAAISQAVATDLQESFAGAEILKRAKGFVHPGGAYEDPADAATARISKLARGVMTRLHAEVERSVTFFRSQQGGGKPVQAWLLGGGAILGYTDLFFREKLRIPVEFFQPFRRLGLPASVEAQAAARNFSMWGGGVGTALQALPDSPVRINVLGAIGRAQAQKSRDVPARGVAAVAGAGL